MLDTGSEHAAHADVGCNGKTDRVQDEQRKDTCDHLQLHPPHNDGHRQQTCTLTPTAAVDLSERHVTRLLTTPTSSGSI
ncbi:hypothetical protein Q5P01_018799 [Channa striata]|uniref:Uncharacterized protein n=1 Tax=Channa striata TaxID=64152 RepID=A0AA88M7B4_CHASR|nr:hypothetical protein Q5P01_018799 [Channa striata]